MIYRFLLLNNKQVMVKSYRQNTQDSWYFLWTKYIWWQVFSKGKLNVANGNFHGNTSYTVAIVTFSYCDLDSPALIGKSANQIFECHMVNVTWWMSHGECCIARYICCWKMFNKTCMKFVWPSCKEGSSVSIIEWYLILGLNTMI